MTKVFIETDYEEGTYELVGIEEASVYLHRHSSVYEVPKKLIRRHKNAMAAVALVNAEIDEILNSQVGEPSPRKAEAERPPPPQVSVYQLRHVKTRMVYTELTVPAGESLAWQPQPDQAPDGLCQWYAKHMGDKDFAPLGEPLRYDGRRGKK